MTDKEHKRHVMRIIRAIEASNKMLRKAGIQIELSEQSIHVPNEKKIQTGHGQQTNHPRPRL